ncbi:efflux RND transporter periplasmic adaptor subunit [Flavobacterium capsici]|uniref:Efflux RND transporter periplasmic adaptor subunit n=1 Tax=Flavobacterium capsici TaxID=3075618 RepID=A0AA96EZN4_9FLAO|nr:MULTISPECIES: efflux RND transporter periplasmic adaptor subunit [unclassified Flavobacterium]WNM20108.1 efflux RND transporter periplasmic adaptor subunit [Flavobacterium sp. PMR2A8]WNM21498.1 efflux RND transporter periplasmic adaptor subunit [Flavobacterium sp. PMTSA4]
MKITLYYFSLVLLVLTSCKHEEPVKEEAANYLVTLPEQKDTIIEQEYVGQVRAIQHIELRALEKGYLEKIFVDEGQHVKKGQLIFKIKSNVYQAEVQKAQAEAEYAKREYLNTKMLADSSIVSPNELALSKAHYNKTLAELEIAKTHLGFTEIRAPFDGIIGRFNDVRLGSLVEEGELLTTLSDNSKMWVYFNVPEKEYLSYVSQKGIQGINQLVRLKMANDEFFMSPGKVETIEADFNNETGNITFRATFDNSKGTLRHGQTGKIYLPKNVKDAVIIPQKATFEILDKKFVYVIKNHKVVSQPVEVTNELPHLYVLSGGVTAQDTLLVEGLRKVKNGETIATHYENQGKILSELDNLKAE